MAVAKRFFLVPIFLGVSFSSLLPCIRAERMKKTSKQRDLIYWTAEQEAQLRKLWSWTDSITIISRILRIKSNAVFIKASRLGLPRHNVTENSRSRRPWSADEKRIAKQAIYLNKSLIDTAKDLGRSLDAVVRKLKELLGEEIVDEFIFSDRDLLRHAPPLRCGVAPASSAEIKVSVVSKSQNPRGPKDPGYRKCPLCRDWRWSDNAGDRYCKSCRKKVSHDVCY
jgi:hypothetical protein